MATAMVVLGTIQVDLLTVAMGIGLLAYVWFTRHARYEIFQDRLVIYYGTPRIKSVPLSDIGEVRLIKASLGGQDLLVRRKGGGVLVIRPRDAERFAAALGEARGVSPAGPADKAEVQGQAGRRPEAQANKRARSRNRRSRNRRY
ncbi:MAG: PH domain-containing protein [Chloroflexota bacterium]